jgi:hypothetical protein
VVSCYMAPFPRGRDWIVLMKFGLCQNLSRWFIVNKNLKKGGVQEPQAIWEIEAGRRFSDV